MFKSRPIAARRKLLVTVAILFVLATVSFFNNFHLTAQVVNPPEVVGIAKTPDSSPTNNEIDTAVRDAIALAGGLPDTIGPGKKVVIQPNLTEAGWPDSDVDNPDPGDYDYTPNTPGVVTDVRVVRTIINMLIEAGVSVEDITICEGAAAFREHTSHAGYSDRQMTLKAFYDAGFDRDKDMFDDVTGVKLVDANYAGEYDATETGVYPAYPEYKGAYDTNYVTKVVKGSYWVDRAYYLPKCVAECDALIRVPVLKNHDLAGYTGGIKLAFGVAPSDIYHHYALPFYKWDLLHGESDWYGGLGELENNARGQADMTMARPPDLTVIDGLVGITTGPTRQPWGYAGTASPYMGCIIAGHNVVATDTIGCLAIGYYVSSIPGIQRASEKGLGTCDINNIEVKGAHLKDIRRWFPHWASSPSVGIPGDRYAPVIADLNIEEDSQIPTGPLVVAPEGYHDNDTGIIKAELYVDGTLVGTTKSAASDYQITWNVDDLVAEGSHTLKYVMYDGMLNEGSITRHINVYKSNGVGDTPVNESLSPNSGTLPSVTPVTLTSTYSDEDGFANIKDAYLIINTAASTNGAIYLKYDASANRIYLRNDTTNVDWLGGYAPGDSRTITTNSCTFYCKDTTVEKSGTTVTINWTLAFKSAMEGKTCGAWAVVWDSDNNFDGDHFTDKMGTFKISRTPKNNSVSPSRGTITCGSKVSFSSWWADPDGAADLADCEMLINTGIGDAGGVKVRYDANDNKIYLRDDADTTWLGGYAPGDNQIISNSSCKLYCRETVKRTNGSSLYVTWKLEMNAGMADKACTIWYLVQDDAGSNVGWSRMGAVNIIYPVGNLGVTPKNSSIPPKTKVMLSSIYSHNNGYTKLADVYLFIGMSLADPNGARFKYDSNNNKIYVSTGLNGVWSAAYTPGAAKIFDTPYCRLHCNTIKVGSSRQALTVKWAVEFKDDTAGTTFKMWQLAYDDNGLYRGWDEINTINIALPPANDSIDPSAGTIPLGVKTTFTSRYTAVGANTLSDVYLSLNNWMGVTYFRYNVADNKLYARNSMSGAWSGGFAPGSTQTIDGGLCYLYCNSTTVLKLGSDVTVNWSASINNARTGTICEAWMLCYNDAGLYDGWDRVGHYTLR